jgi:hypothetical protein
LKTEEKTERQCGQSQPLWLRIVCQFTADDPIIGHRRRKPAENVMIASLWTSIPFAVGRSTKSRSESLSGGSGTISLESLILAQDERWRRA